MTVYQNLGWDITMITDHVKKYKAKWNTEWRKKHPEEYRKYNREYQRKRRKKLKELSASAPQKIAF